MRFEKCAIWIFRSKVSGKNIIWESVDGFRGIKLSAKSGKFSVEEMNDAVEIDCYDVQKKCVEARVEVSLAGEEVEVSEMGNKKETVAGGIEILIPCIEVGINDGGKSTTNNGGKSTTHDCVKNAYYDGGLKCKSTKYNCMKNACHDGDLKSKFTNDQEVLRVAIQECSGTKMITKKEDVLRVATICSGTTKTTTIKDETADVLFRGKFHGGEMKINNENAIVSSSDTMTTVKTMIKDEKADSIFCGKCYGTTMNEDEEDDYDYDYDVKTSEYDYDEDVNTSEYNYHEDVNTSEYDEHDNLSKEGVGMYNSGTQVSVVSDDMSDEMGVTIYICKTGGRFAHVLYRAK